MDVKTRIFQLLDKVFDEETSRNEYFKIVTKKQRKDCAWNDQWDQAWVQNMIGHVKANKDTPGQKYDVVEENGVDILILKRSLFSKQYRKVLVKEESYDVLSKAHRELGHQGYKPIFSLLKKQWKIPFSFVTALISSCNVCKIVKNIQFVRRDFEDIPEGKDVWRMAFLDMETECPYITTPKHILICEDVFSEFLMLRPLEEKSVEVVSKQLIQIFLQFGCPATIAATPTIIYEVLGTALRTIAKTYPQFVVTADDQDSVTAIRNCDIINALKSWIDDVECTHYEIDCELGCHVVQRKLNTRLRVHNSKQNPKFKAFLPHNLFMKHIELVNDLWDENVIVRMVEHAPIVNKRKRKLKQHVV